MVEKRLNDGQTYVKFGVFMAFKNYSTNRKAIV